MNLDLTPFYLVAFLLYMAGLVTGVGGGLLIGLNMQGHLWSIAFGVGTGFLVIGGLFTVCILLYLLGLQ